MAIHPHGADHVGEIFRRHRIADPAVAEAATAWDRINRFHRLALFADAVETLAALRRALPGHPFGLITNGPAEVQRAKIQLLGVERPVDFAAVSGEFGVAKPDPAIFAEALRLGGTPPPSSSATPPSTMSPAPAPPASAPSGSTAPAAPGQPPPHRPTSRCRI